MAKQFLIKNTMADMRALSAAENTALTNGTYSGVQLLGYYQVGDTPSPINYYLSSTADPDNGGSVIEVWDNKFTFNIQDIDVSYFGLKSDGNENDFSGTNNLAYFTNALEYVNLVNGRLVCQPNRVYLLKDGQVKLANISDNSFKIDFNNSKILLKNADILFSKNNNIPYKTFPISANLKKADTKIKVNSLSDLTGVNIGDLIEVSSPALTHSGASLSQYYVINDIDLLNLFIYIDGDIVGDVTYQQIIDDGKTGEIILKLYKLFKGMEIKNLNFISNKEKNEGIVIRNHNELLIKNVNFYNARRFGIYIQYGGKDIVEDCKFYRHGFVDKDQGYTNVASSPDGFSFGYGLIHARNAISKVSNCEGYYGWHTFDCAIGQTVIQYNNCTTYKDAIGFSSHEGAWNTHYNNCNTFGGNGISCRAMNLYIRGCYLKPSLQGHGISGMGVWSTCISDSCIEKTSNLPGSPIYLPSTPIIGAGAKSANEVQSFYMINSNLLNANAEIIISCDKVVLRNILVTTRENEYANLRLLGKNINLDSFFIKGNIKSQCVVSVGILPNQKVILSNVKSDGNIQTQVGSATIFLTGALTVEESVGTSIEISNCSSRADSLVRALSANSNIRINKINNNNYGFLGNSDASVKVSQVYDNVGLRPEYWLGGMPFDSNSILYNNNSILAKKIGDSSQKPSNSQYLGIGNTYTNIQTGVTEIWDGISWKNLMPDASVMIRGLVNQSSPSMDVATAPGLSYAQSEVQAILTELRDLKTKLRSAGILAP